MFVFGIILFSGCNENNKTKPQQEEKEQDIEKPLLVEAPKDIISLEQANAIYTNYSEHRIPIIENYETKRRAPSDKFEAARFVDFDYETLKKYLAYIDQEAAMPESKK